MTGPTRGRWGEPASNHQHNNNTKGRDSSATQRREEKKSDEFAKYMELWKHSLLSCIFTENDAVDSAPAIVLPGVRWAVFNVVWL